MAREVYIDDEGFKLGLQALDDTTKAPLGAARTMENCRITDKGGIAPRLGTQLLGTKNTSLKPVTSIYNYKRSLAVDEILIKAYDTTLEGYSLNRLSDWFTIKNGYTSGQEFGFVSSLVNTDNQDYVMFSNRYEPYSRWSGALAKLTVALIGAETVITVDSTLVPDIYDSQTAIGNTATTFTIGTNAWSTNQWNNFYVYIPSTGKIRKISATTATTITFDTLGVAPGNVAFQIRLAAFPGSGTLSYGGNSVTYTSIDTSTTFICTAASVAAINTIVTTAPDTYIQNPRGNRLTSLLNRIIVGNVRSALATNNGGAASGWANAGSYFVSKVNTPTDFTSAAPRIAGDGDMISTPYGGGDITDIVAQESVAYIFKKRYIETLQYTQDTADLANRSPIKSEIGAINHVIKGSDDVYFMTDDNKFTSLGRVKLKDVLPQTENIGLIIKRLLDTYGFDAFNGIEYQDRIYFCCKSIPTYTANDIVVVYNKYTKSFEGIWNISATSFARWNNLLYFGDSTSANVFQMLTDHADIVGTQRFPIVAKYATHFMNLSAVFRRLKRRQITSHADRQAMHSIYIEGYIKGATTITFQAWKDFSSDPFLQFNFKGSETTLLDSALSQASLGGAPISLAPLGTVSTPDAEGYSHFQFRVYFPFQYGNHFSVGHQSSNVDDDYEIIRYGLGMAQDVSADTTRIKSI